MRLLNAVLAAGCAAVVAAGSVAAADGRGTSAVPFQPSMNVFRRFAAEVGAETIYVFYRGVLGFEGTDRRVAVARDWDGRPVEAVIVPDELYDRIEVGPTVSDTARSRLERSGAD